MQGEEVKVKTDKIIVDVIHELMKDNPDGVSFSQIYEHGFDKMGAPKKEVVPTSAEVFHEVERLCEYDQIIVRLENGMYAAPDLDEYARGLGIFDLIKSIK